MDVVQSWGRFVSHAYMTLCAMISCAHDIVCTWLRLSMTSCVQDIVCTWHQCVMPSCVHAMQRVHASTCIYDIVRPWNRVYMTSCVHDILCTWHRASMTSCVHDSVCAWHRRISRQLCIRIRVPLLTFVGHVSIVVFCAEADVTRAVHVGQVWRSNH